MEIAILVFLTAIFGGVLFLLGLIWFIFRRIRNSGPSSRNVSGGSTNYGGVHYAPHRDLTETGDEAGAIYAESAPVANQAPENAWVTETAQDSAQPSQSAPVHESRGEYSAPGYTESSYSSSDSGSSYDSGSSSSDSGSSSSSSD